MVPPLFQAIRDGNVDEVKRLIAHGVDLNEKLRESVDHGPFIEGVTPLMVAAAAPRSTAEIVRVLLEAGADPFQVSDGEVTALWFAAGGGTGFRWTDEDAAKRPEHPCRHWGGGDVERLRLLLDAGLDPNESARNARTAVGEACRLSSPERTALLIERGASVWPVPSRNDRPKFPPELKEIMDEIRGETELPPNDGESQGFESYAVPLFQAARAGCSECVRMILAQGFPADFRCGGESAMYRVGSVEVAQLLWQAGVRPERGAFGFDAIDEAVEKENYEVAAFFLENADPATKGDLIQQKLFTCSGVRMSPTAIRMLLELGANPRVTSPDYGSALHSVCWQGDGNGGREDETVEETVRLLISAGADPNLLVNRHGTPLHEAVVGDWGSPTSVRVLLELGARPDTPMEDGATPLMLAADHGEVACVRLLLAAGAKTDLKDKSRRTAKDYAKKHLKIWREIVRDSSEVEDYHQKALEDAETVVRLLEK